MYLLLYEVFELYKNKRIDNSEGLNIIRTSGGSMIQGNNPEPVQAEVNADWLFSGFRPLEAN